jgi:hypothetical protein
MIDLFLKLIDRIIDLLKTKQKNKEVLFREIAEPLFLELQPVIEKYFLIFKDIKAMMVARSRKGAAEKLKALKEKRHEYLQTRIKVTEMAFAIKNGVADEKVVAFAQTVLNFFYPAEQPSIERALKPKPTSKQNRAKPSSAVARHIEFLEEHDFSMVPPTAYTDDLNQTVMEMEDIWGQIAQQYAALRLHCLLPATPSLSRRKGN